MQLLEGRLIASGGGLQSLFGDIVLPLSMKVYSDLIHHRHRSNAIEMFNVVLIRVIELAATMVMDYELLGWVTDAVLRNSVPSNRCRHLFGVRI
jgi:hypothetical protein